jgi:H+-translocating NAD(P) transhydrogenase subunit alpha
MIHLLSQPIAVMFAFMKLASESDALRFSPAVLIASLYVFALAAFLGYQVISRVPPLLHTPLMSATNAISGISLIGSLVIAGSKYDHHQMLASLLGCAAVITDRMLKMFRKKEAIKPEEKK